MVHPAGFSDIPGGYFMWIDIVIAVIMVLFLIRGARKGFLFSLISTLGWVISLLAAFLFRGKAMVLIDQHLSLREDITIKISEYITHTILNAADTTAVANLPDYIRSIIQSASATIAQTTAGGNASQFVDQIMTLIAFLILTLAIRLVIYIAELIVRNFLDDFALSGSTDIVLGILFGFICGACFCYILISFVILVGIIGNIGVLLDQLRDSAVLSVLTSAGLMPFTVNLFDTDKLLKILNLGSLTE